MTFIFTAIEQLPAIARGKPPRNRANLGSNLCLFLHLSPGNANLKNNL